jgi:hypothetical protein
MAEYDIGKVLTSLQYREANFTQEVLFYCEGRFRLQLHAFINHRLRTNKRKTEWFMMRLLMEVVSASARLPA